MTETPCVATDADLMRMKRECWNPNCKRLAFIRDWKGWKWCFRCWWRQTSETHWFTELCGLRIF